MNIKYTMKLVLIVEGMLIILNALTSLAVLFFVSQSLYLKEFANLFSLFLMFEGVTCAFLGCLTSLGLEKYYAGFRKIEKRESRKENKINFSFFMFVLGVLTFSVGFTVFSFLQL